MQPFEHRNPWKTTGKRWPCFDMALEALRPEGGPAFPPHLGMASTGRGGVGATVLLGRHQTPWGFEPQRDSEAR